MAVSENNQVTGNPGALLKRRSVTPTWSQAQMQTASSNIGYTWRDGQHLGMDVALVTNAGSSGGIVTLSLPTWNGQSLTIDSSALAGNIVTAQGWDVPLVAQGQWWDQGVGWKWINGVVVGTTTIRVHQSSGYMLGTDLAAADALKLQVFVPILEWR